MILNGTKNWLNGKLLKQDETTNKHNKALLILIVL